MGNKSVAYLYSAVYPKNAARRTRDVKSLIRLIMNKNQLNIYIFFIAIFRIFPAGKSPFFQTLEDQTGLLDDPGSHLIDTSVQALASPSRSSPHSQGSESSERFSRKVFVGGLPPDIDEGVCIVCRCACGAKRVDNGRPVRSGRYLKYLKFVFMMSVADEITASFRRFGQLVVDWPHKAESKSYFPPKGYAFLLFQVFKKKFFFCF